MVEPVGIKFQAEPGRQQTYHGVLNSRMKYYWVSLLLSPCILLNSSDAAAVTNFYHSFTNKKFGGDSSCVTATDVSSSSGIEGDLKRVKK